MKGIVLLGLGPGGVEKLTREAWEVINNSEHIWVRTNLHPVIKDLPSSLEIHSFDDYYENGESIETVYSSIVEKVLALGTSQDGIIYAVPGDPFVAEATCPEIARRAGLAGIPVRIINGLSFLEPVFSALEIDPFDQLTLLDGIELSQKHIPPFPPDIPVLIAQIHSRLVAAEIKMTLNSVYPDDHSVRMIHAAGTSEDLI
jgi:tetrapyrrole methylase family protein/MazG family protein